MNITGLSLPLSGLPVVNVISLVSLLRSASITPRIDQGDNPSTGSSLSIFRPQSLADIQYLPAYCVTVMVCVEDSFLSGQTKITAVPVSSEGNYELIAIIYDPVSVCYV
ncbi:MAG: hypothetical protein NTX36_01335 [Proteobacteria bacterium]|nr:hypothetical protein [Pseudomonadota bacterium]